MDAQFSSDGNGIVSGGQECVAVYTLWKGGEELRRNFVPRLDAPIGTVSLLVTNLRMICENLNEVWVHVQQEYTFVSMASNCIQIIVQNQASQRIGSLARSITSQYPAGISHDAQTRTLISNGRPGTIQFYRSGASI